MISIIILVILLYSLYNVLNFNLNPTMRFADKPKKDCNNLGACTKDAKKYCGSDGKIMLVVVVLRKLCV